MKMIPLSVAGGYWTGSSAVVDLLAEHSQCSVVPYEFSLFSFGQFFKELYQPMLNGELDQALAHRNLQRFDAFNHSDLYPFRAILRRVFRKLKIYPAAIFRRRSGLGDILGERYQLACEEFSTLIKSQLKAANQVDREELNTALRQVIVEAVMAVTTDKGLNRDKSTHIGVFDQIVAPPFEGYCTDVLPELRYINVDRDWRDQYISIRNAYQSMLSVNDSLDIRPWDEDNSALKKLDPVHFFINLRNSIDEIKQLQKNVESILWINFEDLVYDREKTALQIFDFLGIQADNWTPDDCFHPEVSAKRTKKWQNPRWQSKSLRQELQTIAGRLGY